MRGEYSMRVAIIGAGLAGLACCHELERHGVDVEIFEIKDKVGESFPIVGALLNVIHRPIKDPLISLADNYNINLNVLSVLKEITMYSPNKSVTVKGNLGYLFRVGQDRTSIENQIEQKIKSKIHYNYKADVEELSKDFDYVVVASGSSVIPKKLDVWKTLMTAWVKGAVVYGDFKTYKATMWLDTEYAKSCYAYLFPLNEKSAVLVTIVPYTEREELEKYWKTFWRKNKFEYEVLDEFDKYHPLGYVYPNQLGKTYFIGIAGGFMETFLGFGVYRSICSGVICARCIVDNKLDFQQEIQPIVNENMNFFQLRLALNKLDNKGFDSLLGFIGTPGIKQLIYNSNLNVIRMGSNLLRVGGQLSAKKFFDNY